MLSFLTRHLSQPLSSPLSLLLRSLSSSSSSLPTTPSLCPGCGVHMQSSSPSLPGFFSLPSPKPLPPNAYPFLSNSLKSGLLPQSHHSHETRDVTPDAGTSGKPLVCARCHSLRHYGRVKNPSAENLLPDFDFEKTVGPRLASPCGAPSVVLLLADAVDFDGSFPKRVSRLISSSIESHADMWKEGRPSNLPRPVLVVSKTDLLPKVAGSELERWAWRRARAGGLTAHIASIHVVSAVRNWGVRELMDRVQELAGARGNVWAVGAQNVGKSTLINAMAKWGQVEGEGKSGDGAHLTEASVPGTTLGILSVEGVFGGRAKLFDTPGILHPGQITTRLNREEQKLVHVSKQLQPRTYRIKVGQCIHVGGLVRVDIEESTVETVYVTVWASPLLPLHMGKIENAPFIFEHHFGLQLQPPIGKERVKELGHWVRKEFKVSGNSWDSNSADIAVAGLGWFAIGLNGDSVLGVWTYDGVEVVSRKSLIHKRAAFFEEAGFTVSKIVSRADSLSDKSKQSKSERKKRTAVAPAAAAAAADDDDDDRKITVSDDSTLESDVAVHA